MRILITGMTSRQTNPEKTKKDVMFPHLMAEAMRSAGHYVELRRPNVEEDISDFDHVFLGLAPLHGLGSSSAYGAISVALRNWGNPDKLSIYLDDPDCFKVVGGIRTMTTDPGRFTKPFFAYRREYDIANSEEWRPWLREGVTKLNSEQWPRLIVPMHAWADAEAAYGPRVPQAQGRVVGLDMSAWLPTFDELRVPTTEPRKKHWIYEDRTVGKWRRQQPTAFETIRWGKDSPHGKRPDDPKLFEAYQNAWGVLAPPTDPPGWWTSRLGYAMMTGAVYCTKWQDVAVLGEDFQWLPYQVEELSEDERDELAERQSTTYGLHITPRDTVVEQLETIIGAKVPA